MHEEQQRKSKFYRRGISVKKYLTVCWNLALHVLYDLEIYQYHVIVALVELYYKWEIVKLT